MVLNYRQGADIVGSNPSGGSLSFSFNMEPVKAVEFFKDKGLTTKFDYRDLIGKEHDTAFTVAKMMDNDLLATVKVLLDQSIKTGTSFEAFTENLLPDLVKKGWWGKAYVKDPLTGKVIKAQLGSMHRLETIFRTNMQSAYSAGKWESIVQQADEAPYLMYDAVDDNRTRADHAQYDGKVFEVNSSFWDTHYPPNGWNCRCGVIQMDKDELNSIGVKPSKLPILDVKKWTNPRTGKKIKVLEGLDPGWDHNAGKARLAKVNALYEEKLGALPTSLIDEAYKANEALDKARKSAKVEKQALESAKAIANGTFITQKSKAVDRMASLQIEQYLKDKTPYKASAVKKLEQTKAWQAMTPKEKLEAVKVKAKNQKSSNLLNNWFNAKKAGKTPNDKQQAEFDNLPETAQTALYEKVYEATGVNKAKATLTEIINGTQGKTKKQVLQKIIKSEGVINSDNVVQIIDKVETEYADLLAKKTKSKYISGYKKKVLEGKAPSPKELEFFNALTDSEKTDLLAKIEKEKLSKLLNTDNSPGLVDVDPVTPKTAPINPSALTQVGSQKGSNTGGTYIDGDTGIKWYVKTPDSKDNAVNEYIANRLYALAGVDVPDIELIQFNGKTSIASKIVDDLKQGSGSTKWSEIKGVHDGFLADAWLANWDVAGLSYDNLLIRNGKAFRIDTGGALLFRATGGLKPNFGAKVDELDTLLDKSINPQASTVFKGVTLQDKINGAKNLAKITNKQIDDIVDGSGLSNDLASSLKVKLKVRKDYLIAQFPEPKPKVKNNQVSKATLDKIKAGITSTIQSKNQVTADRAVVLIKGLMTNKGSPLREKDRDRYKAFTESRDDLYSSMKETLTPASWIMVKQHYDEIFTYLDDIMLNSDLDGAIKIPDITMNITAYNGLYEIDKYHLDGFIEKALQEVRDAEKAKAKLSEKGIFDINESIVPTTYTAQDLSIKTDTSLAEASSAIRYTGSTYRTANKVARLQWQGKSSDEIQLTLDMSESKTLENMEFNKAISNFLTKSERSTKELINDCGKTWDSYHEINKIILGRDDLTYAVSRKIDLWGDNATRIQTKIDYTTPGNVLRINSTVSTSISHNVWSGDLHLVIKDPRGFYIGGDSNFPSEKEILLNKGGLFEIEGIEKHQGHQYIVMRMLSDDQAKDYSGEILEYAE